MAWKRFASLAVAGLALAATVTGSVAAGSPAGAATHPAVHPVHVLAAGPDSSVNGNCNVWTDGTTFGIGCTGLPGWRYAAAAWCNNGDATSGPTESGTSGVKSYAYCSSVGSTIDFADPGFISPNCSVGCIRTQGHRIPPAGLIAARPDSSVNGNCNVWSDTITFGIGCTGLPGWDYDGNANCYSGNTAYGPGESGTSGTKSYAYCSTYHSFITSAWSDFYR